ncbi:MAG: SDR family NAD(P)-dependent oxidoreductase [Candidatus Aminicenantales bacterium]
MAIIPEQAAVLITGCSTGIGRAVAVYLAKKSFTVFAGVRKDRDAETIRQLGLPTLLPICPLDLTQSEHTRKAVLGVEKEIKARGLNGLNALVNNAGGGFIAPVELIDVKKFRQELETRVLGSLDLVQKTLPLLRRGGGRVVWIMTPAIIPTPYVAGIHACDFAVNCLARTLDIELKPWGIPQIMIRCGGIKTGAVSSSADDLEESVRTWPRERFLPYKPLLFRWREEMDRFDAKRTEPEEVAEVVFKALCSRFPRRRYSVGYMARAAAFLEFFPQAWADFILKIRF